MSTEPRLTAVKVMDVLEDHLHYHENKLDGKLHNHHIILFGEKGDAGMCAALKELNHRVERVQDGYGIMKNIGVAILITLLANVVMLFIK